MLRIAKMKSNIILLGLTCINPTYHYTRVVGVPMLLWLLNFSNKNMADKEEQEVTSEPVAARRAESFDSEGVARLIKRQTENLFGRVNTDDIMWVM